jgi:hypothetical protein
VFVILWDIAIRDRRAVDFEAGRAAVPFMTGGTAAHRDLPIPGATAALGSTLRRVLGRPRACVANPMIVRTCQEIAAPLSRLTGK